MEPPRRVRDLLTEIRNRRDMNEGVRAMKERSGDFRSSLAATLTGVAIDRDARAHFDNGLDEMWEETTLPTQTEEIVIGSGLHAAVYCAVRVANGHPKPLVIEQNRVGGIFAVSKGPTFYLNSRNRPGPLGTPGREEALNVLPGAPIQPADLSGDEYQRNSDLAFAIRATLAMYGRVVKRTYSGYNSGGSVTFADGTRIVAKRLIKATGLGAPLVTPRSERELTFPQFMARLDDPFPFRDMKRVAVIGAGDSGRTVIEALTGQGPSTRWSVASLDWVEKIDWLGIDVGGGLINRENWEVCNRSRYKGIGRLLGTRVNGRVDRAVTVVPGYNSVLLDGVAYDYVIWCNGFKSFSADDPMYIVNDRIVARQNASNPRVYYVGPAANLLLDNSDSPVTRSIGESKDAIFRVDRTASLAASLLPISA